MKKTLLLIGCVAILSSQFGCTSVKSGISEPPYRVNFTRDDYVFSPQLLAEAETYKIFGIDFSRLFLSKEATLGAGSSFKVPIVGSFISDRTELYAAYNLLEKNPDYDVVFFPSFESKRTRFLFLFSHTKVKVRARLAKVN
jgi:hypothetical protein